MCIEINANHPFVDSFEFAMEGDNPNDVIATDIKVEYQWKPSRCVQCKVFGHDCAKTNSGNVSPSSPRTSAPQNNVWVPVTSKGKGKLNENTMVCDPKPTLDSEATTSAPPASVDPVQNNFAVLGFLDDSGDTNVPSTPAAQTSYLDTVGSTIDLVVANNSENYEPSTASPDLNPIASKIIAVDEFVMKRLDLPHPSSGNESNLFGNSSRKKKKKKGSGPQVVSSPPSC